MNVLERPLGLELATRGSLPRVAALRDGPSADDPPAHGSPRRARLAACPGLGRPCRRLDDDVTLLTSLHRAPPRGSRSPAMALLGFVAARRIGAWRGPVRGPRRREPSFAPREGGGGVVPAGPGRSMPPAANVRALSKPCPPGWIGAGRPVPALLRLARAALPAASAPASGPRSPSGVPPRPGGAGGCFPRVSPWGSPPRRPGAPVYLPVPSSCVLSVRHARRRVVPGTLESCERRSWLVLADCRPLRAPRPTGGR
jgi:hypothetical protein